MNNLSPQYPEVPAWSQFRARIRSALNDLFYSDRSPDDDRDSGFTLRKLFAIVWVIAALTVTWQFDLAAMLLVGVPVGLLGYSLLAHGKCHPGYFVVYLLWGAVGYYYCYLLPYSKTRIQNFPPTASKIYAHGDWFCERVRFSASVDDCRQTAENLVVEDRRYFSKEQPNPRPINKKLGQFPTLRTKTKRPWWFDPQNIEVGWQYEFYFTQIWIDAERGLFFYEYLD